jgi:L-aminopeptidase/D-esterase-like protein
MRNAWTVLAIIVTLVTTPAGGGPWAAASQPIAVGTIAASPDKPVRARDLGIPFEGKPGPLNAITDVKGVLVGQTTLISGEGPLVEGKGPVRTGVTVVLPRGKVYDPVFAGWFTLNGMGEMTGLMEVKESGYLDGPIAITNTHSVGTVHEAVISWIAKNKLYDPLEGMEATPTVGETWDAYLNDMNGLHVKREHVIAALDGARPGPVAEGNVGGGTGNKAFWFKAGIGTASRVLSPEDGGYTVGVLVQANFGARSHLLIAGVPVGHEISDLDAIIKRPESPKPPKRDGSMAAVVATDAPLMPNQLERIARRVAIGMARVGNTANTDSGEVFVAFSTANPGTCRKDENFQVEVMPNGKLDPLFDATVFATEEAIVNSLIAARTMTGIDGNTFFAIPHDRLKAVMKKYNRLNE